MNHLNDGLFHVLFVTTPSRALTPRFSAYFDKGVPSELSVMHVLKRREPVSQRDEAGSMVMGWGTSCTEADFEAGCLQLLKKFPATTWINVESELRAVDIRLLNEHSELGVLLSGHEMTAEQAMQALDQVPASNPIILALESESMMLAGARLLEWRKLAGLAIGTSYLSESSRLYDQMGLSKYRSLMRGLAKRAAAMGCRPFTTSNYCTFEISGLGDKSKVFVSEQVDFISQYPGWGSLTRFYSHLDIAQKTRLAQKADKKDFL